MRERLEGTGSGSICRRTEDEIGMKIKIGTERKREWREWGRERRRERRREWRRERERERERVSRFETRNGEVGVVDRGRDVPLLTFRE